MKKIIFDLFETFVQGVTIIMTLLFVIGMLCVPFLRY